MSEEKKPKIHPAQNLFESGQAALEKGDYYAAFTAFSEAAEKEHPQAHYCLAKLYDQNIMNIDDNGIDRRLATAKKHLRQAVKLGFFPPKLITLLNKLNDQILRQMLKTSLQKLFTDRNKKSFHSILTFLKVDDKTRTDFNELYEKEDQAGFEALLKTL